MKKFFEIIFCQLYKWNSKNVLSTNLGAMRAISLVCLFAGFNMMSVYLLSTRLSFIKYSADFFVIIIIAEMLMYLVLCLYLLKRKKYLIIVKNVTEKKWEVFGLSQRALTYLYVFISLALLISAAFLNFGRSTK